MKICKKCGEEKSFELFYSDKTRPDGYCWQCKECQKSSSRKYASSQEVKNHRRIYNKQYHQKEGGLSVLLLLSAKRRAKLKSIPFDLDFEWVSKHLEPMVCAATGMMLSLEIDDEMQHTYNRPSIDSKDSTKGYTKDNCQIVSVIYNKAKSDGTHEQVLEMAKALLNK